jgi:hypothetical protein
MYELKFGVTDWLADLRIRDLSQLMSFRGRGNHLPGRRHGIASAHFMCPSKPSDVAMAR